MGVQIKKLNAQKKTQFEFECPRCACQIEIDDEGNVQAHVEEDDGEIEPGGGSEVIESVVEVETDKDEGSSSDDLIID